VVVRSLAEALSLHRREVALHLLDEHNRDGLWTTLEMVWSLVLSHVLPALLSGCALALGHWLRGCRVVFLSAALDPSGAAFEALLSLSAVPLPSEVHRICAYEGLFKGEADYLPGSDTCARRTRWAPPQPSRAQATPRMMTTTVTAIAA
jgi:hypothetical protein